MREIKEVIMTRLKPIIAIDGPVGAGKSTTARDVARRLGFLYIDSGAMYRAVTVAVLDRGIAPEDENAVRRMLDEVTIELKSEGGTQQTCLNGRDVTERIRDLDVTRAVSAVSAQKAVRDRMTALQRTLGENGGVVMEGRDIGTVVFPDAEFKIYLDASLETRAQRRHRELLAKGIDIGIEDLQKEIAERDRANTEREIAPLKKAPDAICLDTSAMTLEEQVSAVADIIRKGKPGDLKNRKNRMEWPYRIFRGFTLAIYKVAFRIRCTGLENVPETGGVIIAPNHASFFDPPAMGVALQRQAVFFAKKELFKIPVVRKFLDVSHSIPVDRGGFNRQVLKDVILRLKQGYAVVLFPEGTRTRTGDFLDPKTGIGMVAVMADVPIVPVWIEGSYKSRPFRNRLTIHFLPPFHPAEIQAPSKKDHYLLVSERIMYDIKNLAKSHQGRALKGQIQI